MDAQVVHKNANLSALRFGPELLDVFQELLYVDGLFVDLCKFYATVRRNRHQ